MDGRRDRRPDGLEPGLGLKPGRGALARLVRVFAVAIVLIAAASIPARESGAAGDGAKGEAAPGSFAGRYLVALPEMTDPRFSETVIYLVEHDANGAFGLIVNRTMGEVALADLLDRLGIDPGKAEGSLRIYYGGPVEPGLGFVIHSRMYRTKGTRPLGDHLALSPGVPVLRDLAAGRGPRHRLIAFGYAGWGPGQLEAEIARGGWAVIEGDPGLIFGRDDARKWQRALDLFGIDL